MDIVKLLPLLFVLISKGGAIADIVKQVLALVESIVGLFKTADAPTPLDVTWLQSTLIAKGLDPGPVDGKLGPKTQAAIRAFQTLAGIEADGWAGPETMAALIK